MSISADDNSHSQGTGSHILVFPYPAQGHMLPLLDLTHHLALRGLTITVVVTPKNLPTLTPLLSTHPSIQTLVLPFPSHPKIPPGVENVKDIGNHGNMYVINALADLHDPIIQWFNSHANPPVAIISDFFLPYPKRLADKLKIPTISFYSCGAFVASVLDYCWKNIYLVRSSSAVVIDFPDVPRSPSFKKEHIPSVVRLHRDSDPESELLRASMLENSESWAFIFNGFKDLESKYFDHMMKIMGHNRIYGVGPLSLIAPESGSRQRDRPVADYPIPDSGVDVLKWLDGCPDGSVIYVCFGSQKLLNGQQMEALASGLEKSGVRFVWAVKEGSAQQIEEGLGVVPDGLEERVAGRGVLIKSWAPQELILGHRAVGGFISHCGWNSVLEAMVSGVLILAWPMEADQFVNAKLLVKDMGVAVQVGEGANGIPDPAHLGKMIHESLIGNIPEKVSARVLRDKAFGAVRNGGSSSKHLDELVKELGQLKVAK